MHAKLLDLVMVYYVCLTVGDIASPAIFNPFVDLPKANVTFDTGLYSLRMAVWI